MGHRKKSLFLFFTLYHLCAFGQESTTGLSFSYSNTVDDKSMGKSTLAPFYVEQTNMPESDFDDALHVYPDAAYSTVSYSYVNDQYLNWFQPDSKYTCYDHYVKCLLSQTIRHPVCAMHRPTNDFYAFKNLPSVCDMYWYNCKRGFRYLWVMKYGVCGYYQQRWNGRVYVFYSQGR